MVQDASLSGLPFMKMHGAGNDFVVIDGRATGQAVTAAMARAVGDRHRGVGFDQLAEILPGENGADVTLRFWNADGSTAGACGNATRCVAAHLMAAAGDPKLSIRTERGLLAAEMRGDAVWVNMGLPQLDWRDIPLARELDTLHLPLPGDPVAVGMGNPHCVHFVDDVAKVDVAARGAAIEHDPLYPQATNVEFAEVRARDEIRLRVWERGTGITLACGSGTCATVVAAVRRELTGNRVKVEADGGWLEVEVAPDGVWMTGPVAHVLDGVLTAEFIGRVPG